MAKEDMSSAELTAKIIKWAIVGIILCILIFGSFFIISAGQRGIVLTFGNPNVVPYAEGIHFKIPLIQSVVKMNVQTQKYEVAKASAASKDLQTVTTDITINYYVNPDSTPTLYKNIGINYQDKVIAPAVQEVMKAATAQYTAEELITKRAEVKDKIDETLTTRLKTWDINVQSVAITNFDFSEQFNTAIEAKVTAEQNALAAKNKLAQVEYEAQQRVTQAKGESEAIAIQAQAINAQGGKDYVSLQAINKWNGQLPTFMGGGAIPFINMDLMNSNSNYTGR